MTHGVQHFEFWSQDPAKLSDFYRTVFQWDIQHFPDMEYWLVNPSGDKSIGGGIMKPKQGPWPSNMSFYINVDDLEETRSKLEAAGAKIILPFQEVPNVGAFCLFADPEGRVLGIWKQTGKV
ncbi:MAG: VOC family protein [Acidobacteria bacterium]|nr:VOC family protein [Acidobacteriota bacterium]